MPKCLSLSSPVLIRHLMMALSLTGAPALTGAATCDPPLRGINIAGPAFAPDKLPGRLGYDYKFPTSRTLAYYRSVGFRTIRLSILWERLQPELLGSLDAAYLSEIRTAIESAGKLDLGVVLDLHNYARYRGQVIGTPQVPNEAFRDVWTKLVSETRSLKAITAWGLMNEPYRTNGLWEVAAQAGVDGVRAADRTRPIYVAGESYSSAARWPVTHPQPFVVDPVGKEIYEAHLYLDPDSSGRYVNSTPPTSPSPAETAVQRVKPFADWLGKFHKQGVIGEFGVPATEPAWFDGVGALIDMAERQCIGTFVWAGGAWSPGYKLSLEPLGDQEKPLTGWFRSRFGGQSVGTP